MAEMKLVPVEPTREMTMAGAGCLPAVDGVFGIAGALSANVWSAMLAASPQAPAREGVDGAAMGRLMAVLSSDYLRGPAPIPGLGAVSWDDLRAIAALTPREEAPAEGAGDA